LFVLNDKVADNFLTRIGAVYAGATGGALHREPSPHLLKKQK
jgi:hypothetical protein